MNINYIINSTINFVLSNNLDWGYYLLPVTLLIFILFYVKKPVYALAILVLFYFLAGYAHLDDISLFHLYLAGGLAYLCYLSGKSVKQTSLNFLVSLTVASFLIFSNHWVLVFALMVIVVLISFLFLGISPYLLKYLGLEAEGAAEPSLSSWKDRLKDVFYSFYYDPKYMRCIGFWKETFPHRMAKATNGVFMEVLSLVCLSLSTFLHTRYRFLLPAFFIRCILFGHLNWMFWYFVPIIFLTLLVYYPPYVDFMKKVYHEDVFKELGWNMGINQAIVGAKAALTSLVGTFGLVVADDYYSVNVANPAAVDREWADFRKDHRTWTEARNQRPTLDDFLNEPTPPNADEIRKRRVRHSSFEALKIREKFGGISSQDPKIPKPPGFKE